MRSDELSGSGRRGRRTKYKAGVGILSEEAYKMFLRADANPRTQN